ncbi:DNA cross-link repair 1A protein [Halichoerus grypus]|uniref:DNA cross-link repair 1A protein isoform X1 n=1 Tax=Halichoerus grypus TaxID=9711 RepID=UPI0016590900|nr:DNA cross-link repair 1A protein isoform X1 [Halichoerus grypus]XP_035962085.1 DNA cross-link repair 1A protein isoform X1 [Halichoerus grypus]XP_035962086.1 DNA cross-link repair 1A protein isoform X1 [Halichoerus grypus]XP_035962087.1 DNA cross-link repair 1A protein isoform X1 [Halichoerus grypus]
MLEDAFLEEDIWEYKSKRKPKPVHTNNCSETMPKSVEKATDGKHQSKRNRNKKRTAEAKEKTKDPEMCLGETDSQTSVGSSQNSSCGDGIPQSQDKETASGKHCRTRKNKQVSPKIRPVYDGYCPNCQMPFSSLLGQTPRWHVFECLDSPSVSETECPDGLLCTSTIPSHFKRYTHLLLAQSRAGSSPFSSPPHGPRDCFSETNSGFLCGLEERWSVHQKPMENLRSVSTHPSLVTPCLKKSQSPTETDKKISSSSTNIQPSQQNLQFPECVNNDKLVGVGLPLAEELDSQSNSEHRHSPLPENDFSSCEISYSPLQTDEETYSMDEKLGDLQQELLFTESSKDGSLEEDDNRCTLFQKPHGRFLKDQQENGPHVDGFLTQDKYQEVLYKYNTLTGSSQLFFQNKGVLLCDDPAHTGNDFALFPSASAQGLTSSYQAAKAKPGKPECHPSQSNKQKQAIEESAVCNQISLPSLTSEMPRAFKRQGEGDLSFHPTQSKMRKSSNKNFNAKNNANSACVCRKALGGRLDSKATVPNTENSSSALNAAESLTMSPSGPKCPATQPSSKVMKQMDIGVYFGLPPKRKEEKLLEGSAVEGMNLNPVVSPNEKRSRQRKRKAEKSLSDLELDAKNLSESQPSVELSSERSRHQRKRLKKSVPLQEGAHEKRSHHLNRTESGRVNLRKDKVFIKSPCGRLQRGNTKIPESPNAGQLRTRTCPFYKKIPGTGFTVDAFQYGLVEGCTAYFLTHFHSDHYAGLSKNFTFPIYCSEITGNLLKSKLHVQKQYIHPLPMDTECIVNGVKVILLDANHCPGAVMILFYLPNGNVLLHTGDFRADPTMERSRLAGQKVHTLYLDTTYCSPEYSFPSQQEVIQFAINTAFEAVTLNPRVLVVCGTYSIGKEKVFLAIADVLGSKVGMSQEKYKTLQCLNIPELNSFITTDMCSSLVHLLPMMQINFKALQSHLKKCGGRYDQILAFRPTGWTHSNKLTTIADIIPQTKGNISIYGIPYSEHSSYLEMKRFVQWLKPQKIIPTVNVGALKSKRTMEKYFKEWKLEAGY